MSYALAGAAMDKLPSLLPSCYSAELDDCRNETDKSYPGCADILAAEAEGQDAFDEALNALPWCPGCYESAQAKVAPDRKRALVLGIAAGAVAGAILGIAIF